MVKGLKQNSKPSSNSWLGKNLIQIVQVGPDHWEVTVLEGIDIKTKNFDKRTVKIFEGLLEAMAWAYSIIRPGNELPKSDMRALRIMAGEEKRRNNEAQTRKVRGGKNAKKKAKRRRR